MLKCPTNAQTGYCLDFILLLLFFFFWLASLKLKINDIIQINTGNETLEMFGKFKRGKGDGGAKFIC